MVLFCFLFSLTSHILDGWHQQLCSVSMFGALPQFQELSYRGSRLSVLPPNPPSLLLLALHTWPTLLYSALLHWMALVARLLPHLSTLQSKTVHSVRCTYIYQQCWFSTALKCVTWTRFHMLPRITEIKCCHQHILMDKTECPRKLESDVRHAVQQRIRCKQLYCNGQRGEKCAKQGTESIGARPSSSVIPPPPPPSPPLLPDTIPSLRWALFFLARW